MRKRHPAEIVKIIKRLKGLPKVGDEILIVTDDIYSYIITTVKKITSRPRQRTIFFEIYGDDDGDSELIYYVEDKNWVLREDDGDIQCKVFWGINWDYAKSPIATTR